jgi:hypothetical protein
MRKIVIAAAAAAVLLAASFAGWYFVSPGLAVKAIVEAAQENDEARFSSYVDYPSLREDMKAELTGRLQAEAKRDGSPEAKLGLAMGMAMMGPLVDSMVSPKGMKAAFANLAKEQSGKAKAGGSGAGTGKQSEAADPEPEIRRIDFNTFVVTGKGNAGSGLVFERRGLGWKLAGVELSETLPPPGR